MKHIILLLTTMSFMLIAAPIQADDRKDRRIGGVKSSEKYDRSSRNSQRNNRNSQRREQRSNQRSERRADRRTTQRTTRQTNRQSSNLRNTNKHYRQNRTFRQNNFRANRYRANQYNRFRNTHYRYNRFNHNRFYNNGFRYNRFYRNQRVDRFGYLLGGVVIGSTLANSHRHDHHHDDHSSTVTTTRVIREGTYGRSVDDVHLFRDRDGNCFEISENRYGDEIRQEIDPSYCEW